MASSLLDKIRSAAITPVPPTAFDYVSNGRRAGKTHALDAAALASGGRPPGKRGTISMSDMMIPGFNSEAASSHPGGPDAYRAELTGKKARPAPVSDLIITDEWEEIQKMDEQKPDQENAELAALVDQYEDAFRDTPKTFSLGAPGKHTTLNGREYKIKPFIGGEEFEPVRAYIGKKLGTIIVLKPKYPADFEFLEVPEKQCKTAFGTAFPMYMHEVLSDVLDAKEELTAQVSRMAEVERNAGAAATYQDLGFGSW